MTEPPGPTGTNPGRTRPGSWLPWAAGAAATLVIVAALVVVWAVTSNGGQGPGLRTGGTPQPTDPDVQRARKAAEPVLAEEARAVTTTLVLAALGDEGRVIGRGIVHPECVEGQHNWTRNDLFDLYCTVQAVELVALTQRDTFETDMSNVDAALREAGWQPPYRDMATLLDDYWLAKPAAQRRTDQLPPVIYTRATPLAGVENVTLTLSWSERESRRPPSRFADHGYAPDYSFTDPQGSPLTPATLVDVIPADGYVVEVIVKGEYFRR